MSGKAARIGEFALVAQNVDEHAVAALGVQAVYGFVENLVVIHVVVIPALLSLKFERRIIGKYSEIQ